MSGNKYRYLAKNTIVFTISSFGSKLLAFLLVPFYTSVLSTSEYGTADLVTTSASLLIFAVTICISDAVLRFGIDKDYRGVFKYGLTIILKGFSLFGALLLLFSFFNPIHWEWYLYLFLFLTLCSNALNQIVSNYLRAIDKIYSVAIMGIMTTIITITSNIVLLLIIELGVIGYLISFVVGYSIAAVYGLAVINKNDRGWIKQKCDNETKRLMVKYSLPLIPNGLAWWMNSSLDRYFIIYFCGVSLNGLYAVASKIPTILNVINQIFHQAWNLSAIREFDKDDKDGFFKLIYSAYNYVLVISCSLLIFLNIHLAKILFSKDFFSAWEYSSVLLLSAVFSALSGFIGSVFVAVKQSKIFALSTVIAACVNTVLNWALIPKYGVLGAAIATVISFFIIWLIRYECASKYIRLRANLYRDLISYGILVVQVIVEHLWPKEIWVHIIAIIALALINQKDTKLLCIFLKKIIATKLRVK